MKFAGLHLLNCFDIKYKNLREIAKGLTENMIFSKKSLKLILKKLKNQIKCLKFSKT